MVQGPLSPPLPANHQARAHRGDCVTAPAPPEREGAATQTQTHARSHGERQTEKRGRDRYKQHIIYSIITHKHKHAAHIRGTDRQSTATQAATAPLPESSPPLPATHHNKCVKTFGGTQVAVSSLGQGRKIAKQGAEMKAPVRRPTPHDGDPHCSGSNRAQCVCTHAGAATPAGRR